MEKKFGNTRGQIALDLLEERDTIKVWNIDNKIDRLHKVKRWSDAQVMKIEKIKGIKAIGQQNLERFEDEKDQYIYSDNDWNVLREEVFRIYDATYLGLTVKQIARELKATKWQIYPIVTKLGINPIIDKIPHKYNAEDVKKIKECFIEEHKDSKEKCEDAQIQIDELKEEAIEPEKKVTLFCEVDSAVMEFLDLVTFLTGKTKKDFINELLKSVIKERLGVEPNVFMQKKEELKRMFIGEDNNE